MTPFRNILVPVDFSPSSRLSLDYALMLADRFESSVHVLHCWEVPSYLRPDLTVWSGEVSATLADHARDEAERGLRDFMHGCPAGEQRRLTSRVVAGSPYSTIVSVASDEKFDLIVMGTHGRTGLGHLVLGSVAEKVVRHAHCAVLTVRDSKQAWSRWIRDPAVSASWEGRDGIGHRAPSSVIAPKLARRRRSRVRPRIRKPWPAYAAADRCARFRRRR
jgi:universal stress protein A